MTTIKLAVEILAACSAHSMETSDDRFSASGRLTIVPDQGLPSGFIASSFESFAGWCSMCSLDSPESGFLWFCPALCWNGLRQSWDESAASEYVGLEDPWKIPGRSLEDPWKIPGRSLEDPWKSFKHSITTHPSNLVPVYPVWSASGDALRVLGCFGSRLKGQHIQLEHA